MVSLASRPDGDQVAARDLRVQERDREVLQDAEGERTRRFYNNLTSDRLENLESFMDVFMLWYNHLRRHQGLGRTPVQVLS